MDFYRIRSFGDALAPGAQPALHFGGGNFHELSFADIIIFIQPWHNFFANGHRYVLFATFLKMRTYWS